MKMMDFLRSPRSPAWALLGGISAALAAPGVARADCESGIAALTQRLTQVNEPHVKAMLQTDLRAAEVELWEFDEPECAMQLEHAAHLLATIPPSATNAAAGVAGTNSTEPGKAAATAN